jgi:hypothetical protein
MGVQTEIENLHSKVHHLIYQNPLLLQTKEQY